MFAVLLLSASCGSTLCEHKVLGEYVASDGVHIATVFERSCGAPSPIVTVVGLREAKNEFKPDRHKDWIFTIHGRSSVGVEWEENESIHISYTATGDRPTMRDEWNGIRAHYN
jgi:hypothetical protein